jgi:hypothetical protein
VGANKAIAIHPRHHQFFTPLGPERLHSPPLKNRGVALVKITALTRWKHVPLTEMGTAFALRNNVINSQLFFPFAAISAGALTKWPPQKIIFKNALTKSAFCVTRAKFNERMQQLIGTIRSKHGTIKLS